MTAQVLTTSGPGDSAIDVSRHVVGRRWVLSVAGEIDMVTAPELAGAVDAAISAGALELWIDLTATRFMDSSGLHVLLGTHVRLRALNRPLAVICPGGAVRRVFEVAGVDGWLPLFEDHAAAHRGR